MLSSETIARWTRDHLKDRGFPASVEVLPTKVEDQETYKVQITTQIRITQILAPHILVRNEPDLNHEAIQALASAALDDLAACCEDAVRRIRARP